MTRFEQFQQNVQRWATERGIYEHSTRWRVKRHA